MNMLVLEQDSTKKAQVCKPRTFYERLYHKWMKKREGNHIFMPFDLNSLIGSPGNERRISAWDIAVGFFKPELKLLFRPRINYAAVSREEEIAIKSYTI